MTKWDQPCQKLSLGEVKMGAAECLLFNEDATTHKTSAGARPGVRSGITVAASCLRLKEVWL